jgi:hypothetical protein
MRLRQTLLNKLHSLPAGSYRLPENVFHAESPAACCWMIFAWFQVCFFFFFSFQPVYIVFFISNFITLQYATSGIEASLAVWHTLSLMFEPRSVLITPTQPLPSTSLGFHLVDALGTQQTTGWSDWFDAAALQRLRLELSSQQPVQHANVLCHSIALLCRHTGAYSLSLFNPIYTCTCIFISCTFSTGDVATAPRVLRAALEHALSHFPAHPALLSVFVASERRGQLTSRLRRFFDSQMDGTFCQLFVVYSMHMFSIFFVLLKKQYSRD